MVWLIVMSLDERLFLEQQHKLNLTVFSLEQEDKIDAEIHTGKSKGKDF